MIVSEQEHRLGGDERRALDHGATAQPRLQHRLRGGELRPVVDAHDLRRVGGEGSHAQAALACDADQVGQVKFPLRILRRHGLQKAQRLRAGEGDRSGIAERRRLLRGARVLVLADRDHATVALDEAAVAGRIGGREAERDEVGAIREALAHRRERRAGDQRNVRVTDDDVVVAARNHLARRQYRVGGAATFDLNENIALPALSSGLRPRRRRAQGQRRRRHRPVPPRGRPRGVGEHGYAGDLMQNLGPARAHAHPLAGREDDGQTTAQVGTHTLLPFKPACANQGPTQGPIADLGGASSGGRPTQFASSPLRKRHRPFSLWDKLRLAASKKTIYNLCAGDGTRDVFLL